MDSKKKKKALLGDIAGIGCGVLILIMALLINMNANAGKTASVKSSEIPANAVTVVGTAEGRNGEVSVEVTADENNLYRIKILDEEETDGIGTLALKQLPGAILNAQNVQVDNVSGATITSEAVKTAIYNALKDSGIKPATFGASLVKIVNSAKKVETGSGITIMKATDWAEQYPEIYESYMKNAENRGQEDYVEEYPMIKTLYDGYGFAKYYDSARGHMYVIDDVTSTGRPHALANCWTCKVPEFTAMVNEMGDAAYQMKFEDVQQNINEPLSCYNCHANEPGLNTVTHTYLINGVGEDFEQIDGANLACGQCHNEYYFDPDSKATTLPHNSLESMSPDDILAYYNDFKGTGEQFSDYTNPNTGVKQIKVQHPELETYLGEGSVHRNKFTCADCHMGDAVAEDGTVYKSHYLISPLDNEDLIKNTCSECHTDLEAQVRAIQSGVMARETKIGNKLETFHNKLAEAVTDGSYSEEELNAIRDVLRSAQFYWDFVFVENSEGAHNSALTKQCLDKSEALIEQGMAMFK